VEGPRGGLEEKRFVMRVIQVQSREGGRDEEGDEEPELR
jgi:hypothetical protein